MAAISLSLLLALPSRPQKGTAPNGYYPPGYTGTTFTGVTAAGEGSQLVLYYTKGNKQERFVGHLDAPLRIEARDNGGALDALAQLIQRRLWLTVQPTASLGDPCITRCLYCSGLERWWRLGG